MTLTITVDQCASEEDAVRILRGMGYHTFTADVPAADNALHWHDFDATFFIVGGEFAVRCDSDDEFRTAGFGARIDAPRGILHRERHDGYRGVFGFAVDPATITMPLERSAPVI